MTFDRPRPSTALAASVFAIAAILYVTIGISSEEPQRNDAIPVYVVTTVTTAPATSNTTTSATEDTGLEPTTTTTVQSASSTTSDGQAGEVDNE